MAGEQVLVVIEDCTPALTDLHVLETGFHATHRETEMLKVLQRLQTLFVM